MATSPAFHEDLARDGAVPRSSDRASGIVIAALFALVGLHPLLAGEGPRSWALVAATVLLLAALLRPVLLAPLNRVWLGIGALLHRVVSPLVLAILFFGVVWPTGLALRLLGKRTVPTSFDRRRDSYWIPRDPPGPPADGMTNQF